MHEWLYCKGEVERKLAATVLASEPAGSLGDGSERSRGGASSFVVRRAQSPLLGLQWTLTHWPPTSNAVKATGQAL
jgi:hypothetical protein